MRVLFAVMLSLSLLLPLPVFAADQSELMKKIEELSMELESLKKQVSEVKKDVKEEKAMAAEKKQEKGGMPSWLEIGGDYRFRVDSMRGKVHDYMQYNPNALYSVPNFPGPGMTAGFLTQGVPGYTVKNETLITNRFGLNVRANATEDVTVKARLLMYKIWGHETENPVAGNFFADRAFGPFDGVIGHVPSDNALRVDQAYATWSNIGGAPVWFSVGRRPSTGGVPTNLRQNTEKIGNAGIPGLLVDYAFDGLTIGAAPDINALPGAYAKLCYGRGFDSGFNTPMNKLKDTDFLGIQLVPVDTDNLHAELQWQRGFNIFNVPSDGVNFMGMQLPVTQNMGDIDWIGGVVLGRLPKLGAGDLTLFGSATYSNTSPNSNTFALPFFNVNGSPFNNAGFGLLYDDDPMTPGVDTKSHSGYAVYIGGRYDLEKTGTKIGPEYNHQEIRQKAISKKGKAFVRLGYQHYDFQYTGSNNWVGEPKKISDLNTMDPSKTQLLAPLKNADNIYFTFDVTF
ncbi:MAG: DUF3373 family protein [Nitrospirae bacterium]|nr:DUF3373 family protein [Nitrospirota bacterium]